MLLKASFEGSFCPSAKTSIAARFGWKSSSQEPEKSEEEAVAVVVSSRLLGVLTLY